jgi:RimJ/RimL family protein N-acetyltransferase
VTMKLERPPVLTDGSIRLRPLSRRHVDAMAALGGDPDVLAYTYVDSPFSEDDAVAWVGRYVQGWKDGSCAGFAIEDVDGRFLGFCSLVSIDAPGLQAEVGYITAPAARGRGVASRALSLITDWALDTVGLLRLELRIDATNEPWKRVAARCGYEREGCLRSLHFKRGLRADVCIYSRLPGARGAGVASSAT